MARHNADFALARSNHARAVRTDQAGTVAVGFQIAFGFEHVQSRYTFGNHNHQAYAGINGFNDRVQHKRSGNVNYGCVRAGFFNRFFHGVEHRQVQVGLTAFARSNAADDFSAVSQSLFGVESTVFTGETLNQYFGVFINQYAHSFLLRRLRLQQFFRLRHSGRLQKSVSDLIRSGFSRRVRRCYLPNEQRQER